jgi:drug/metabolite transporter (DMT)-like permease
MLALLSGASFGTIAVFAKLAYQAGLQVDQLLALRYSLAAVLLISISVAIGHWRHLTNARSLLLALLGLTYGAQALFFFVALQSAPASIVELVFFLYPALVAIGAWRFLAYRPGRRQTVAIVASFIGITLIVGTVRWRWSIGLAFALCTPILYAAYLLVAEPMTRGKPAAITGTWITIGAAVEWVLIAGLRGHLTAPTTGQGWLAVGGLVAVPSLAGIPFLMGALRRIGSSRVAVLGTVEPVVTVVSAVIVLGESLSLLQVIGAAIVLACALLVSWDPADRPRAPRPPV